MAEVVAHEVAVAPPQMLAAGDAGTFTVAPHDGVLTVVAVSPSSGWTFEVLANDAGVVKVAFHSPTQAVLAVATIGGGGGVAFDLSATDLPKAEVATPAAPVAAKTKAQAADDDHDGWCDHRDGDGFRSASFDGDHHRDGDRDGWRGGDHDGWRRSNHHRR